MGANRNVWLALGLAAAFVFFFNRRATAAIAQPDTEPAPTPTPTEPEPSDAEYTPAEIDALTSMLFVETGWRHGSAEESGIVNVARNRANKYQVSLVQVVSPPGAPVEWNAHQAYRERYRQAKHNAGFDMAREKVTRVLAGVVPNPIGNRTHMLHLARMVRCDGDCSMKYKPHRWRCVPDPEGVRRCVPIWAVSEAQGGTADSPIMVGEALFS